jgi:lactobin A/cerein 7B family class IIb bacteriocin
MSVQDTNQIRELTDAELNDVNGGVLAAIVAAGALAALVIGGWDNGSIYSKEQQAAALGLSHLL